MLLPGVNVEATQLHLAHAVRRKHAPNGALDEALRVLLFDLLCGLNLEAARETRVTVIDLLIPLLAAEFDLIGVDDDDVIAVVDVRRPGGLVLTGERAGDPDGEGSKALTGRIDDVPVVLGLRGLLLVGTHRVPLYRR